MTAELESLILAIISAVIAYFKSAQGPKPPAV